MRCFDIFGDGGERWLSAAMEYCFSPEAHISLLVRLMEHGYVELRGTAGEFSGVVSKVVGSRCEVGKYASQLEPMAELFGMDQEVKSKYVKLVKVVEFMYVFGRTEVPVEEIYPVVYTDPTQTSSEGVALYQEAGLNFFKMLISGFFDDP
jgi:hypothetical protein